MNDFVINGIERVDEGSRVVGAPGESGFHGRREGRKLEEVIRGIPAW